MDIIEKVKEFLREMFSRETIKNLINMLKKVGEGINQVIGYIESFLEWLYGKVVEGFKKFFD